MEPVDWLQSVPPAGQILCPTIFSRKVANYSCFRCFPTWDLFQVVYAAGLCLHILELIFSPPARYPDIFPVLNVLVCTPVFGLVWLWSIKCSVEVSWALGGLGPAVRSPQPSTTNGGGLEEKNAVLVGGSSTVGVASARARPGGPGRAVSLGYAQGRRRVPFGTSSVSVDGDRQ